VCLVVKSIIIAVVLILAAVHLLFAGANFQVGEAGEGVVAIVAGVSLVAAVALSFGEPRIRRRCALFWAPPVDGLVLVYCAARLVDSFPSIRLVADTHRCGALSGRTQTSSLLTSTSRPSLRERSLSLEAGESNRRVITPI
jgi:hypothetical protein